jgi:DNA-directed RNA polymerase-3 subunit RPC5
MQSKKNKRSRAGAGSESESDEGPPPDPDEAPVASTSKAKEKKQVEMREINVSTRKADEKGMATGLSTARREMLQIIRAEEEEEWHNYDYCDVTVRNDIHPHGILTFGI